MSVSTEVRHSTMNVPRSPLSSSTDSSRRGSLKQVLPEMHPDLPTPTSPRIRLTRKRAASLNTNGANEARIGDLALNSASTNGPPSSAFTREQVCLCQPDPKIPRPRNAFILYRQHYQAQVVSQNPGLANPEISKIIGQQWREQAQEIKTEWKRLAEEEKQRHQRQYPAYRYQPRRAGKLTGLRPASSISGDDPIRCPKCNGRYISTPSTPLTPFTPGFSAAPPSERPLPLFTPSQNDFERPRYSAPMQNSRMDTPRLVPNHQHSIRRPQYLPPQLLQTHHERDEDMDLLSPSSGQKRRRFNEENLRGYASNSPMTYSAPQQFSRPGAPPMSAVYRQPLPGPGMIVRHGSMGPPPQSASIQQQQQSRHQYPTRSSTFDESLRLPPLQTQMISSTPTSSQRPDSRMDARETHAKSIEAMVMTIPYVNKIKLLTKISPPLAPPGPTSPAQSTRGAVVAVEGPEKDLLSEIGAFINEYLSKDPSFAVTAWNVSESKVATPGAADLEMNGASNVDACNPFVDYMSIISTWHTKSLEMIRYITTAPLSIPPNSNPNTNTTVEEKTVPKILPVALVPTGFSLSTSDTYAHRIPINDVYSPVDHWQWMATLWRGIVGPDLTVYVSRVGKDEMVKYGGVEIKQDCPCIVVRIPEGSNKMDEKTARRLGFEVVEFVRNVEAGFGRV
ncbi:related to mating type protein [Rhynchosporium agropyri]|uniref:Related to mating type protein n=1 Tax=Rhynchosporium agropyri TaxID=914238 RepID=A0A1E1KUX4_9HELO|nr:related to mating type protein [Rhynchosporium agropyri]